MAGASYARRPLSPLGGKLRQLVDITADLAVAAVEEISLGLQLQTVVCARTSRAQVPRTRVEGCGERSKVALTTISAPSSLAFSRLMSPSQA